jgi:AmmeMemoRadiSam system protein B
MASIRPRSLPTGWYPQSEDETKEEIEEFLKKARDPSIKATFKAGVAPHAGWFYSGRLACNVFKQLAQPCDTIVVVGGHMHPRSRVIAALEDGYYTPFGPIDADLDLLNEVRAAIEVDEDTEPDNTVEIQLPFAKYFFPKSKALHFRAPPSEKAIQLGAAIAQAAMKANKKVVVLGSTDLTHYGPNYGWSPKGSGKDAVKWMKDVNDKHFIDALLAFKPEEAIDLANKQRSACSAGAAIAALSFAQSSGAKASTLLDYYTSYDVQANSSFVGYGGILFY